MIFVIGVYIGTKLKSKKVKNTYGDLFTYEGVYEFCGGNPMRYKGIINGHRTGIIISDKSEYNDTIIGNMIYYRGTFHRSSTPESPGHQSPSYPLNKHLEDVRGTIHIFVKNAVNEYVRIGVGKRVGGRKMMVENGRHVMVYPIVFTSGDLEKVISEL